MEKKDSKDDKIKQICNSLRKETLEPAKKEAEQIILDAKEKAAQIIAEAEEQAERLQAHARADIEQEKNVFQSSLSQAAKQSLESLRQSVEAKLFNEELDELIKQVGTKPTIVSDLIRVIIQAIEKEGVEANFEAIIPQNVSAEEVSAFLGDQIMQKLEGNKISIGHFDGGAQVKLVGKNMTIDITDSTLKELMSSYVRKDFRKMIFTN
ncbi:MAG: V-type ATP synthase subunit E [Chlamydiota bacterium]